MSSELLSSHLHSLSEKIYEQKSVESSEKRKKKAVDVQISLEKSSRSNIGITNS
jgi:hypothetical protein